MSVRAEPEQVETTGSERVLAVVLAVFILIGLVWAYYKVDEVDEPSRSLTRAERSPEFETDVRTVDAHGRAKRRVSRARTRLTAARVELELRREAFRTAIEAGEPGEALGRRYRQSQRDFAAARGELEKATAHEKVTGDAARAAQQRIRAVNREVASEFDRERKSHDRLVFALRFGLLFVALGGSYWLLGMTRRQRSRYLPLALAAIGASAALALLTAADYTSDYIEFDDVGPLAISIAGILLTLVAFVALQRYIARRIPLRRVRRGDCPFCGFPVRGNANCEGCGRRVVGECSTCHAPRRVGTEYCGACGAA